ncbi:MAG: PKD domain-containing protein, partial [Bacteroidota bacterium]
IGGISRLQDDFTQLLESYGYDGQRHPRKYWIITEANAPRKAFGIYFGSSEVQRNYLIKAYVQSVRRGFLQLHVYKIGEDEEYNSASNEFGLMGLYQKLDNLPPNNETINESGIAFKTTSDILYGTTYDLQRTQALALPANVDGGAFRNADGKYIYVLWARTQIDQSETANATYDFPTALGLQALYRRDWDHSTTGRQMVIPATGVALTGSPIFLMEQAQVLMPPVAAFSADQPWGCEGMEVRFQEEAARADRFLWTFPGGNPASSTAASPRVRYQSSGTYPVTLEVFNNAGKHAATYQRFIEVRTTPNSDFTFEVDGNWVDFTSVVGYDDSISYFWSYGDGYTSPGVDPDHYYFDNGAYEAQLIATNSCGSDTTTKTVYIKNPPIAQFSRVVSSYCPPHQVLFLDLSPSDPEVWEWEFPGGFPASSSEANPEIEYAQAGWYEARLSVYNSIGSDTTSQRFYLAAGTEEQLREQLCDDEELLVNGTIYNAANPSGTEVIPGVGLLGCDSIIQVDLSIGQSSRSLLASTLCQGEQLVVNGVIYEQSRPNGEETLSGANAEGCDSIVQIALSFHDPAFSTVDPQLCPQEALYINGQLYNQANPQGEEVIVGGSVNGCDSTVVIDLSFHPPAESYLERQLCEGEFVLVNGKRYDQSRPTGTEIIANASKDACDSLVFIDLSFHPPAVEEWTQAHCLSDTVLINGSLYHAGRPNGVELIPGGSIHGCDSSILVDLTFDTAIRQNLSIRLCEGEGYLLGDTYYSLSGTFRDTFAARSGCDSIVELNLQILDDPITNSLDVQLCEGESYNGQGYEQDVVLIDSLVNDIGCDSILYTFVEVAPVQEEFRQVEVCEGRRYHGIRYFADTVITEVYSNAYNCDSSVTTTIDVLPGSFSVLVDTIELGQSYWVGNSSYEQTGSYVDTLVNLLGCDSIVFLELTVLDLVSVGSSVSAVSLQLKAQPNPFVSSIALQFELPTASEVRLELLDVHGRHLWSLIEGVAYPSGSHQIDWQKAHLPPGLYWCRLQAGNQQAVIKLIKL